MTATIKVSLVDLIFQYRKLRALSRSAFYCRVRADLRNCIEDSESMDQVLRAFGIVCYEFVAKKPYANIGEEE